MSPWVQTGRLFVVDRGRLALPAGLAASLTARGAERVEVVFVPGALARAAVMEGLAPGILRHFFTLEVGTAPARDARRLGDQALEPLLRRRIGADVELVDVEDAGEAFDRLVRDLLLCLTELPERRGRHETDEEPEDGKNDKQLQQREAALFARGICARAGWQAHQMVHAVKPPVSKAYDWESVNLGRDRGSEGRDQHGRTADWLFSQSAVGADEHRHRSLYGAGQTTSSRQPIRR